MPVATTPRVTTVRHTGPRAGAAVPLTRSTRPVPTCAIGAATCCACRSTACDRRGTLALNMIGGEPLTVTNDQRRPGRAAVGRPRLARSLGVSVGF